MVKDIKINDFDYPLPDERIARHPLAKRDNCKLLLRRRDGSLSEHIFSELGQLLPTDAMLVYNNTRVINARLRFRKQGAEPGSVGALIEIFCLEPDTPRDYAQNFAATSHCSWLCFVGNSKRWRSGTLSMTATVGDHTVTLTATRTCRNESGTSVVEFSWDAVPGISFSEIISATGEIPIPPYLNRNSEESDRSNYQTVYSHIEGSVAAPTAGLHFTPEVLADLDQRGILRRELTLHVGAGTFQPVKSDNIGEHLMHSEFFSVERSLIEELAHTSRPVIAVGTTSVRTLESLYHAGVELAAGRWTGEVPQWAPYTEQTVGASLSVAQAMQAIIQHLDSAGLDTFIGTTRIIIAPGYKYRIVKGMVTNFHQPRSTLLLLVSAFTQGDWRKMYDYALAHNFRFLSYGDAQLLL